MEHTTIAITREAKEKMKEFGMKGETYADIVNRLIKSATERQLHDLLMDTSDTISAKEALEKAKKRWQR